MDVARSAAARFLITGLAGGRLVGFVGMSACRQVPGFRDLAIDIMYVGYI